MRTSISEALKILYEKSHTVATEILPIEMTLGKILAQECIATFDLPRFDHSSMDGYAVKCSDAGKTLSCTQVIYAGDAPKYTLKEGEVIRIMTGAPVPKGTEAIVPFEAVTVQENNITLPQDIRNGDYIRKAGEDLKKGHGYLKKGDRVTTYKIILLASQGVTHIEVYRPVKVAVFSSGDELRSHYENIEEHQLYNSNTPMFLSRAKELGCEVQTFPPIADTVGALKKAIQCASDADIIITSGGMNAGDKDFTKEAFVASGTEYHFSKVDVKPGGGMAFGSIDRHTAVINLPGNPLGAMVIYELFIRALIHKISGSSEYFHQAVSTKIAKDFSLRPGAHIITLGDFDGHRFFPLKKQRPGMLSTMQHAKAMMITTPESAKLQKDDNIKILPIAWEFFSKEEHDFFTH